MEWFVDRACFDGLLAMFREGMLGVYYYAFTSAPVLKDGVYSLVNLQDEE